jgi:surface antigen
MMFVPRLTRPEKGNKYYMRKPAGYSSAIKGSPTDAACDVLANCVGYAVGRFHEIANRPEMDLIDPVNAENIYQNAQQHGLKVGKMPQLGALIVWQKGATLGSSDGSGHVAVVEQILGGGRITTSESGYGAKNPFWVAHYDSPYAYKAGYKLLGFVYQPSPKTQRALRKGDYGEDVRALQTELACRGYLRKSEIDGDFGKITLGAVCAYQLENGLTVDGIAGPETQANLYI